MYLHLGNGKYVKSAGIVGVFDMDTATVCVATRRFLSEREKEGVVSSADGELPKSFLLLSERREARKSRKKSRRAKNKREDMSEEILLSKFSSGVLFGRTALSAAISDTLNYENG